MPIPSGALTTQALLDANTLLPPYDQRLRTELAAAHLAIESLSRSLSHDLRAPVRAIDSLTQILSEDYRHRLGEEGEGVLQVIQDGCHKMDQLITGLLAFSRANLQPLDLAAIDMNVLARDAADQVRTRYGARNQSIEIAALPPSVADALLMRDVWCQLLDNALKYSAQQASATVRISGRVEGREAIYQVQDNGLGFDMHYVHNLFGVFQRLHKPEDFAGTGVGLAIVHSIILRHGGRVWAQGAANAGASFQFSLPIVDAAEASSAP
jgi:light-regulated signal transduction histidine kinase (bacteriophytochrome)